MRVKRYTLPKEIKLERKTKRFYTFPIGPRSNPKIALLHVVRDMLNFARTASEAKKIITGGKVFVDGRVCKDRKFGVGLMDVVSFPDIKKHYRITIKDYLTPIEIPESESSLKICKIIRKQAIKGGKIQITLHDGRNMQMDKCDYKVGDSLLIKVPSQEIVEHYPYEKSSLVYIMRGKRTGQFAYLKEIIRGIHPRVILTFNNQSFETKPDATIVVGKDKPKIQIV
jgi:small subunit ribosomal protein S4e